MFCVERKKKTGNFIASHAEIKRGLKTILIRSKGLASRTTPKNLGHIKVTKGQKEDRSKDQNTTEHIEMLSSALVHLTSSLLILVSAPKGAAWTGLIRSDIMKLEMCDGPVANSKRRIDCREITGSISEAA